MKFLLTVTSWYTCCNGPGNCAVRGLSAPHTWEVSQHHCLQTVVGHSTNPSSGDPMSHLRKRSISVGLQWKAFAKENQDSSSSFSVFASGYVQIQHIQPILANDLHGCNTDIVLLVYWFSPGFHVFHHKQPSERGLEKEKINGIFCKQVLKRKEDFAKKYWM